MVEPPELRGPTRDQVYRRRVVALIVVGAALGVAGWAAWAALESRDKAAPPPTTTVAPPKILQVLFPEGFTRAQMAERADAASPAITARGYLAATASSPLPGQFAGDGKARNLEGFLFPATYDLFETDPATRLVRKQLDAFRLNWGKVKLGYARSKNLTGYDVLIIASMIEKEVIVPKERALVAAVIYNRLHRADAARDRRDAPVRARDPADAGDHEAGPRLQLALQHAQVPRAAADPDRQPGLASMQAAAHPAKVDYLYFVRKPDCRSHFFTASIEEFDAYTRKGLTNC